jgi:peptide deformylase
MLPITAYGHPTLKKVGEEIDKDYPGLEQLIEDMFETMYNSRGVGLAAHQINKAIRLFVIDATPYGEDHDEASDFKKIFINAKITSFEGDDWEMEEGCLSVPGINEYVKRKTIIKITYFDENFVKHEEEFDGIISRIIQHEYDHIEGKVFVERLPQIKKMLLKRKLNDISIGISPAEYKMIYPRKKGRR